MLRTVLVLLLILATALLSTVAFLLETRCELPAVAHAVFLAPADPGAVVLKEPKSAAEWSRVTVQDLMQARRELEQNTPIPFDSENPHYAKWLVNGYEIALDRAARVTDYGGYTSTLTAYLHGFQDPHLSFGLIGEPPKGRWPGFIVSQRGDGAEVVFRDETDPRVLPVGAKIVTCDGRSLPELARERVFPFRLIERVPPQRRQAITRLFFDRRNPFVPLIKSCEIELNGNTSIYELDWRDLPADEAAFTEKFRVAGTGPATDWGVAEPSPGIHWIGVPTFGSGDDTAPKLAALINDVEQKGAAMRAGKAIIIDTRGNGGGNSAWADRLAVAVFGADVLKQYPGPTFKFAMDWRASKANGLFWRNWSEQMSREFGQFSTNRLGALFLYRQLTRFADADPPIYRVPTCHPSKSGGITKMRPNGRSPFRANVYVLSNGSCGSSCLNFADTILMIPGVKLIGSSTAADGAYMDIRSVDLPSKLGAVTFAQKVGRGSGRAALEYYEPDIAYDGLWSDALVRKWVLETVEADTKN